MSVSASGNYGVVAASLGGEPLSLHGTLSVPILNERTSDGGVGSFASWLFNTKDITTISSTINRGQVQKAAFNTFINPLGFGIFYVSVNVATDWVTPNDFQEGPYYIRAQHSTTFPDVAPTPSLTSLATNPIGTADNPADWDDLINDFENKAWTWTTPNQAADMQGIIKVDLSITASEAGIRSTGYYKANIIGA